jgi:hypothetical protein
VFTLVFYDVASLGTYGEIHCTDCSQLEILEQELRKVVPGIKTTDEICGIDGKRCGLRFEKGLDVFFKGRIVWWITQQLSSSGWELITVDAGTRYFKRVRVT